MSSKRSASRTDQNRTAREPCVIPARLAAFLGLALVACASAATRPPLAKIDDPRRDAFDAWVTAERLFYRGARDADRDALVTAARLMERYPVRAARLIVETEPGAPSPRSPTTAPSAAAAHALVAALTDAPFDEVAPIGVGPRRIVRELGPGGRDFVAFDERAGIAEVAVISDGRGDLDLWVLDADGATACSDTETGDAHCRWSVPAASPHELVVRNDGPATTRYTLLLR